MISETKVGDTILQMQTTYYVYANEAEKKKGVWLLSTSSLQEAGRFQQTLYEKENKRNGC